jgi:hypothetical protein
VFRGGDIRTGSQTVLFRLSTNFVGEFHYYISSVWDQTPKWVEAIPSLIRTLTNDAANYNGAEDVGGPQEQHQGRPIVGSNKIGSLEDRDGF